MPEEYSTVASGAPVANPGDLRDIATILNLDTDNFVEIEVPASQASFYSWNKKTPSSNTIRMSIDEVEFYNIINAAMVKGQKLSPAHAEKLASNQGKVIQRFALYMRWSARQLGGKYSV